MASACSIMCCSLYVQVVYLLLTMYFQIVYLGLGDSLHLQTDGSSSHFGGSIYYLTFCATLTALDYCIFDDSCGVL